MVSCDFASCSCHTGFLEIWSWVGFVRVWELGEEQKAICSLPCKSPPSERSGWLAGCVVMLENKPGQLNLTFIMGKGFPLDVMDMAARKQADLAPATL